MKYFKFEQIKILFIFSFLIITFHFAIMFMGDFPGGNYGMVPFLLIIGLPILIVVWILILLLLNFLKINLTPNKVALYFSLSYFLIYGKEMLSDQGMFQLFFYPAFITTVFYFLIKYIISKD